MFRKALYSKQRTGSTNYRFIFKNNNMFSYKQYRASISFFYVKQHVLDDLISTIPIDVTINPHGAGLGNIVK